MVAIGAGDLFMLTLCKECLCDAGLMCPWRAVEQYGELGW